MRPFGIVPYLLLTQTFELFASFGKPGSWMLDLNRFVVARVAAFTGFTLTDFKSAKADDLYFITLGEAVADSFEYSFYSFFSVFLGQIGFLCDCSD